MRGGHRLRARGDSRPVVRRAQVTVALLGRFDIVVEGRRVAVPPGLPDQGVKYVAVHGGRVRIDTLMEALWPDGDHDSGRKGVRNLMSRLHQAGCPILERDGDSVQLRRGTWIDAVAFQTIADRVLLNARHPGAADGARLALGHYRGELLADNLYWDWAVAPRERLRRRRLALIDLLAGDARRRGATQEAINLMELAIEIEPYDELRYLEVAEMLLEAGRQGRAAVYVHRSRQILREYGLRPGTAWASLSHQLQEGLARAALDDESLVSRRESIMSLPLPIVRQTPSRSSRPLPSSGTNSSEDS